MSTRCSIEIIDTWTDEDGKTRENDPVLLYHHSDGYPSFMGPYLERMLKEAYQYLKDAGYSYWWDSERVSATMIVLSMMAYGIPERPKYTKIAADLKRVANAPRGEYVSPKYFNGGVPYFQPCGGHHGDIEYIWRITLDGANNGEFEIDCYRPAEEEGVTKRGKKLDWRKEIEKEKAKNVAQSA